MSSSTAVGTERQEAARPAAGVWILQSGPCWCGSVPTESSSFDYMRLRKTALDPGTLDDNFLIVSERVIDGSSRVYRQVFEDTPNPKVVISTAACPATSRFWDDLPTGWGPVDELFPVDIHIDQCIRGEPETLMTAVVRFLSEESQARSGRDTHDDWRRVVRTTSDA